MNVCRLCLNVSDEDMLKLSSEIIHKISSCLMLLIPIDGLLPNQVCITCVSKVEDVYQFWKCVKQNETLLNEHLKLGKRDLKNLCFREKNDNSKNNIESTDETNEVPIADIKAVNSHNSNNIAPVHFHKTLDSKDYNTYKVREINTEEHDCLVQNDSYSSEDEIILSSLKEATKSPHSPNNVESENIEKSNTVSHGNEFNFRCLSCFKMHKSYEDLQKHYLTAHSHREKKKVDPSSYSVQKTQDGSLEYKCAKCDKLYIDKRSIVTHVLAHTERPEDRQFVCNVCVRPAAAVESIVKKLAAAVVKLASGTQFSELSFSCAGDGRTYRSAAEILRHGRAHGGGVQLACRYKCGFTTGYAHSLRDHEKRHRAEYKYVCGECGRGFLARSWFEQHQNVHSGARPYRCDLCPKAFHMHKNLTSHRSLVHLRAPPAEPVSRYKCMHCAVPFGTKNALSHHLMSHGERARYLCEACGAELRSRPALAAHVRAHTSLKPHACSVCDKSYRKKCSLRVHERVHAGARSPIRCPAAGCHRQYSQRSALHRHLRRKHRESPPPPAAAAASPAPPSR